MLNPKCITMGELYGEFSELTQEWHDGLASTIMRRAVADEGEHRRYKQGVFVFFFVFFVFFCSSASRPLNYPLVARRSAQACSQERPPAYVLVMIRWFA